MTLVILTLLALLFLKPPGTVVFGTVGLIVLLLRRRRRRNALSRQCAAYIDEVLHAA